VYMDRKVACQLNGYHSSSALDNAVKNFTLTKGYYYKLYDLIGDFAFFNSKSNQYSRPRNSDNS
ncbi:MAG: hypothetical protein WCH01_07275, partial [Methylococcaceae bacterium]